MNKNIPNYGAIPNSAFQQRFKLLETRRRHNFSINLFAAFLKYRELRWGRPIIGQRIGSWQLNILRMILQWR
jgi:hypothetical protein